MIGCWFLQWKNDIGTSSTDMPVCTRAEKKKSRRLRSLSCTPRPTLSYLCLCVFLYITFIHKAFQVCAVASISFSPT